MEGPFITGHPHGELKMSYPNTSSTPFTRLLGTDSSADDALAALPGQATKPSGDGVIQVGSSIQNNSVVVQPISRAGDGDTYSFSVHGWREVRPAFGDYYSAVLLGVFACVSGTTTLALGGVTYNYADTITMTRGDGATHIVSPGGEFAGFVTIDTYGSQFLEFKFDIAANTDYMNALFAYI